METPASGVHPVDDADTSETTRTSKRFRFKRKRSPTSRDKLDAERRHRARRHHHGHHRSKSHKSSSRVTDDPSAYEDSYTGLPPDAAFRESLFDAMGDDEGAAFWEGVYGHPIHNFPKAFHNEETGELEQMDDDEYAQFVRRKMWEKSWEGIEAAKEEKRKDREREKREMHENEPKERHRSRPKHEADYLFDLDIEKSLQRGSRRKEQKRWKTLWDDYLRRWDELRALRDAHNADDNNDELFLRNKIAWPVETGKRKDVNTKEIERFFHSCLEAIENDDTTMNLVLKTERIRWHPDKIQQRYGFMGIDDLTIKGVTAVFQALDGMWNQRRNPTSSRT